MLKYSPEEYKELNLEEKDSENMGKIAIHAEKLLHNATQRQEQYLDKINQEKIHKEAIKILAEPNSKEKDTSHHTENNLNENNVLENISLSESPGENSEWADYSSDYYSNAEKDSWDEMFFKTVIEEVPDLGISIEEKINNTKYKIKPNSVIIKAMPYKTDRMFLRKLEINPVIDLLKNPWSIEEIGEDLEEKGLIRAGTTNRICARYYAKELAEDKKRFEEDPTPELKIAIDELQKTLNQLGDVEPLSDQEAKEMMIDVISQEYKKKFTNDDEHELEV